MQVIYANNMHNMYRKYAKRICRNMQIMQSICFQQACNIYKFMQQICTCIPSICHMYVINMHTILKQNAKKCIYVHLHASYIQK